jgi:hypothetical protein
MMMSWKFTKSLVFSGVLVLVLAGCLESEYTRLVKRELAREVTLDSLLFQINFNDSRADFYSKCKKLNQQKLVTQGPNNASVQYVFVDSVMHQEPTSIRLLFYPKFDEKDKIMAMDFEFSYLAWAPWNKKFQSDQLRPKVLELLENWYGGNDFISINLDDKEIPVKLDANRRIMVFTKDAQTVLVRVHNILHPKFKHSISS